MAFRYVYDNAARGATSFGDGAGGALLTATGFAAGDLVDGTLGRSWRSSASATTHEISIGLSHSSWNFVAAFDVRATDGTLPTDVKFHAGPTISGAWIAIASGTPNARGDIGGGLSAAADDHLKIVVTFATAKTLRIGEIYAGNSIDLTRTFADRSDEHVYPVIENETQAGDVYRAGIGERRRTISMGWDSMSISNRDEIEAMLDAFSSQTLPCVIVPDTASPTAIFHGHLAARWSESVDDPIRSQISLSFREDGRGI